MHAAVIVFPGSNREDDVADALQRITGHRPAIVWHGERELPSVDLIVLPGGFAHGDYLRCGAMAAKSPIMTEVVARAQAGVAVLGICNGFQVLCESGLLPGALLPNASLNFVCRDVHLRVETSESLFTRAYNAGQVLQVPVAHHDGNYFADDQTLDRLEGEGRVAFRYVGADGSLDPQANPNGAARAIAGILDQRRRVLGLMPHPEDATDPVLGSTDGAGLFRGLAEALA